MKCFVNVSLICRRHSARELLRQYVRKCTVNIYTMVTVLPPAISSPKGNQPLMRSSLNLPFCRIWNGKSPRQAFQAAPIKMSLELRDELIMGDERGEVHSIYCQTCDWLGNCPYRLHCPPDLTKRRLLSGVGDGVHAVCVEKASCCQMSGRDDLMMGAAFFLLSKRFQFRMDLKGVLHAGRFRPLKVKLLDGTISSRGLRSIQADARHPCRIPKSSFHISFILFALFVWRLRRRDERPYFASHSVNNSMRTLHRDHKLQLKLFFKRKAF